MEVRVETGFSSLIQNVWLSTFPVLPWEAQPMELKQLLSLAGPWGWVTHVQPQSVTGLPAPAQLPLWVGTASPGSQPSQGNLHQSLQNQPKFTIPIGTGQGQDPARVSPAHHTNLKLPAVFPYPHPSKGCFSAQSLLMTLGTLLKIHLSVSLPADVH